MWVISLRSKALTALAFLALLLLIALAYLAYQCRQEQYGQLLLAKSSATHRINLEQIEDFCKDEFLVTYEIETPANVEAHNFRLPVKLIGTNHCYAQIM
ncbi:MAG: hypothetical protein FWG43_02370, partial [Clostridiales bacterium]|nr:hypothetical protein [Clostridiales bacterium]